MIPTVKKAPVVGSRLLNTQITSKIFEVLQGITIPQAFTRTNLWDEGQRPRSMLLGAYTRRGCGVTMATEKRNTVVQWLHKLARARPEEMKGPYVAININHVSKLSIHRDRFNTNKRSVIIAVGNYEGGDLWVEDPNGKWPPPTDAVQEPWQHELKRIRIDVKNRFAAFDPRCRHCIYPVTSGERYSIV